MKLDIRSSHILPFAFWGILGTIMLLDMVLYKPLMDDLHKVKEDQKKISEDTKFATNLLDVQAKANLRPLVSEEKLDDLMYSISDLAEKKGLVARLNSKNYLPGKEGKDIPYVGKTFSVDLSGPLTKLGAFMFSLRDFPDAIIDVSSISINPSRENLQDVQAQLNLTVLTIKQ